MKRLLFQMLIIAIPITALAQDFDCGDITGQAVQTTRDDIYFMVSEFKKLYEEGHISENEYRKYKVGYNRVRADFNSFFSDVKLEISTSYRTVGENVICRKYKDEIYNLEVISNKYYKDISTVVDNKYVKLGKSNAYIALIPIGLGVVRFIMYALKENAEIFAEKYYQKVVWKTWDAI